MDTGPAANFDNTLFMSGEKIGERVLRGIRRRDLFAVTHLEFAKGIKARKNPCYAPFWSNHQ